jgi:hypothetical protein
MTIGPGKSVRVCWCGLDLPDLPPTSWTSLMKTSSGVGGEVDDLVERLDLAIPGEHEVAVALEGLLGDVGLPFPVDTAGFLQPVAVELDFGVVGP